MQRTFLIILYLSEQKTLRNWFQLFGINLIKMCVRPSVGAYGDSARAALFGVCLSSHVASTLLTGSLLEGARADL